MKIDPSLFPGMRITIMGLGLHGGGAASARFFASHGAELTVTDLKSEEELAPIVKTLSDLPIRFVLGKHEDDDFRKADWVIKNPAVPRTSPYLQLARRIETDISVFLSLTTSPIIAVTGSKGKSTVCSVIAYGLKHHCPNARLGGNITRSPLLFLDELDPAAPVVLELSSFQLGDLCLTGFYKKGMRLNPYLSIVTNILPDHQNYYRSMDDYIKDKELIFSSQDHGYSLFNYDQEIGRRFASEAASKTIFVSEKRLTETEDAAFLTAEGGFLRRKGKTRQILPLETALVGKAARINLLYAASALAVYGLPLDDIQNSVKTFPGIPHRMEYLGTFEGVSFYNDSAATIPEATSTAIESFASPVLLITGGTDKNLDFTDTIKAFRKVKALYLLKGSASDKLIPLLKEQKKAFSGPYHSLEDCLNELRRDAEAGDIVLFSPGSASFGMFKNEFDRGDRFRELVKSGITASRG